MMTTHLKLKTNRENKNLPIEFYQEELKGPNIVAEFRAKIGETFAASY